MFDAKYTSHYQHRRLSFSFAPGDAPCHTPAPDAENPVGYRSASLIYSRVPASPAPLADPAQTAAHGLQNYGAGCVDALPAVNRPASPIDSAAVAQHEAKCVCHAFPE